MEEYDKMLKDQNAIGFALIEFERDLEEEFKNFRVQVLPLFGGGLNQNARYALIVVANLGENVEAIRDDREKTIVIKKTKKKKEVKTL